MTTLKKTLVFLSLTTICGIIMGIVTAIFLKSLELATLFRDTHFYAVLFLPAVGILTMIIYQKYGKGSERGNNLIIDSVNKETDVPFRMALLTFCFTILTHITGGSVGREGTAVQIGGTISNKLSKVFKLENQYKRILIMSGISAGFGSVFGTPLAGVFFGLEICFVGKLSYDAILPCFISSFTANAIAKLLGASHVEHVIASVPKLNLRLFVITIMAAIFFGLVGRMFSITIQSLKLLYKAKIHSSIFRSFISSLIILLVIFTFSLTKYEGLSTWMIDSGFQGTVIPKDPIAKFVLTCLTLGAGFQGGEVTPLFDIGASLGGLIGQISATEPSLYAALGLIAVFGCSANAPITTIILGIELFGTEAIPYYMIVTILSYYITGHHGIYQSQVITTIKSKRFEKHKGHPLEEVRNYEIASTKVIRNKIQVRKL